MTIIPEETDESVDLSHIEYGTQTGRKYKNRRWTIGDSGALVEGAPQESRLASAAWVGIPVGFMLLVIALMAHLG